ncbi:26S proteasome non-ATPase regulatory subunit 1-like [Raphidocelis subcapitata]|uniref:26S proteasome non-ATPase regulatory subunit 1 homolog n=1 Tax=Raphidocelis subcapitata TaxID=307507 RepID=A0A2V0NZM5_9CHLO|nr:26S proteasome non-ATPase regulatory subunit 1-like [Raphidocelis subcapitata]|eukprot:GBF90265.1 26S proteasome non-ATPase regulatory subunit 1-like [Raphidocelis subcapitata]
MPSVVSSAAGLLTLLEEPNDELQKYALTKLNGVVHDFWFEISPSIASVEALYEDEGFKDRELAALIASKVFYHLGELDSALTYALGAGPLFDLNEDSEYVRTLVARCLDQYFDLRRREVEGGEEGVDVDPRLVAVVERMIASATAAGQWEQAVGVALEARRLDLLESVVGRAPEQGAVLGYALRVTQRVVVNRNFRHQVLRLLVRLAEATPSPDWVEVCQCLMFLDDAPRVADILARLIDGPEEDALVAYQAAFDLVENEMQSFLTEVLERLPKLPEPAPPATPAAAPADGDAMDADGAAAPAPPAAAEANGGAHPAMPPAKAERVSRLRAILAGTTPIGLTLEFLYHNNKADLQVLKNLKSSVDARVSVLHSATILANALVHAGTSVDTFLRENLEWLSRATNWAKFSATAGLGVIHRGQLAQGKALLAPYLPRDGAGGSPFSEGGALYALGLIAANHGANHRSFLLESLRSASSPVIQHGACLGLGLACLGACDEEAFEDLKNTLYTDDAVAGEAAGLAMGMLLCGSSSDKAQEMLAYAHDTSHEKIIRGLALGLALTAYGREEGGDALVEQMARDQDPILRWGAAYALGLAYRGTANNGAIARLLHWSVSDVSDDVRRAAVTNLGFVLMGAPEQTPRIVALLAESFNPHVRYGAALAVGIACAGSGGREAVALLESMIADPVDFVRQGVYIALALVLLQQPEARVEGLRKRLAKAVADKHEETMARMGAAIATGILDAGGRNVTVGLRSRSGYFRRTSVVGLALFTYHWYWHPIAHCLSLSFTPSALIGLDASLRTPKLPVHIAARPSLFAYPPPLTVEASKEVARVEKAVLSTTAKARERARKREAEKKDKEGAPGGGEAAAAKPEAAASKASGDAMDTDDAAAAAGEGEGEGAKAGEAEAAAKKPEEPSSYDLTAPARMTLQQVRFASLPADSRWAPVKRGAPLTGFLLLRDTRPGEPVEYAASDAVGGAAGGAAAAGGGGAAAAAPAQEAEAPPPAPFEFDG